MKNRKQNQIRKEKIGKEPSQNRKKNPKPEKKKKKEKKKTKEKGKGNRRQT
jgi:hypothetical protein